MEVDVQRWSYLVWIVLALLSFFHSSFAVNGFNGVLSKTIDANVTCGNPKEVYYRTQEGVVHPRQRTLLVCDANDPKYSHPPVHMVDGDLATFWQSKASVDKATIRVDLNQEMFGYELSITFGDYRRPGQIAFYKSKDYGATFEPWHFLVSPPATEQCREVFDMEVTSTPPEVDTVVCQQYPSYFPLEYNETFTVHMNGQQRGDGSGDLNYHTPRMLTWMKITNLKVIFTGLYKKFDRLSTAWHHYAVREVGFTAKCNCHGYADGFDCPLDVVSKERKCKCKGNTCGLYCEKCCPAFNQYPWQQADGAPWVWNGTTTCEACNCHNHSESCVYNETVAEQSLSLDINGKQRGGGMCVDCKQNTDGVNCEKCKIGYYRPINRSKIALDACEECGCNVAGTLHVPNMTYLDCVRDELEMKFLEGKRPGDCYCKMNVMGRTCDICKDGFYDLSESNPEGCRGCDCHLPGTVNASNVCENNHKGECHCKPNTEGRNCAHCKPGLFNLTNENINGCQDCNCDPGAIVPGSFCNNITGSCHCLPHIHGIRCKSIEVGWYYPDLHFIHAQKDLYQPAFSMLSVTLDIPKNGSFRIMIGYSLNVGESSEVDIQLVSNLGLILLNTTLPNCPSYCRHKVSPSIIYLSEGIVQVLVNSSQDDLKLNSVVAIPQEFYENTVLGVRASSHFQFQCNIDDNDMRLGTGFEEFCLSNVFSLTIAYNKGPLSCNCNPTGSYDNSTCDPYGGQCHCKPGVTGRDCSQCLPNFYNFSDSGCKPCDCRGENKLCNVTTGWCECPPNRILRTCEPCQCNGNSNSCLRSGQCLHCKNNRTGFHCEKCVEGTYGNASAADCKECNCDQLGSLDRICDIITGQCHCKKNVVGQHCSQCRFNTFRMRVNGCEECHCNPFGSSSLQCDDTGQCPCLANVEGVKCTQCMVGYYGLPKKPCQACDCSSMGSINGTTCTNDEIGMCVCKPGVSGRACDACKKQYTNFTSSGCSRCTGCSRILQNRLDRVILQFINVSLGVELLRNLSEVDSYFISTNERLEMAKISSVEYENRVNEGKTQSKVLLQLFGEEFSDTNSLLISQNQIIVNLIKILTLENEAILENLQAIRNKTEKSKNVAEGVPELVKYLTKKFSNLVESITQDVNEAQTLFVHLSNVNVQDELEKVQESLKIAQNLSERVQALTDEVLSQDVLAQALELSINKTVTRLMANQNETVMNHDMFLGEIHDIDEVFSTTTALVDHIKDINRASQTFIERATEILTDSEDDLIEAQKYTDMSEIVIQKYKDKSIAAQGELEISMLQYDFKESVFLMKILQARNLLGRDHPMMTSDPYAIISLLPAWRDQASQKSRIVNGTTSPIFPFYDIYRFHIEVDEIPLTKLIITLYDYDDDNDDDCLGEVVIDLNEYGFFNQIVTKWFQVQPKGSTMLNSGHFNVDGIGLIDLTTLLQMQINQLAPEMTKTESKLAAAKINATNLRNIVDSMNGSLHEAFEYVKQHSEIFRVYENITEITRRVVNGANETKEAVNKLINFLEQKSIDKINEDFEMVNKKAQVLYDVLSNSNSSQLGYLKNSIEAANETFLSSLSQWEKVSQYFTILQSKTSMFEAEALKDSTIRELLSFGYNVSLIAYYKMAQITREYEKLVTGMVPMVSNMTHIITMATESTQLINEGVSFIASAEKKLTSQGTPSQYVLAALPVEESFEKNRESSSGRISKLEGKVARIINESRTFDFAMKFSGNGAVEFSASKSFLQNKFSNDIVFDFKTSNSRGGLFYIVTSNIDLSNSLRFYVDNGRLCSASDVGSGPDILCYPDRVDNGEWYRVFFTRYGVYYSLTLVDNNGHYTNINKTSTENILEIDYNEDTMFYVGGIPPEVLDGVLGYYGSFNGVLDHVRIGTDMLRYKLSNNSYGEVLYHGKRCIPKHPPGPYYEAHFFGTGGLWHTLGDFAINTSNVAAGLSFRTLQNTGVILEVLNASNIPVFGIYLEDGVIKCFLQTIEEKFIIASERSSYDDGEWHSLMFNISNNVASLQLKSDGLSAADSRSEQLNDKWPEEDTSDGLLLVFGGPGTINRTVFAGDLGNIRLSNKITSQKMTFRNLVGAEWIKDKGVNYGGVIQEKIYSGIRFFGYLPYKGYGSYTILEGQEEEITQLKFTFKTSQKDGILVYSKVEQTFLYVALWDRFLYVSYNDDDFKEITPLYYKNKTLNDNMWHTVLLNFNKTSLHLDLDGQNIHTGWFGNARQPLVFSRMYFGGAEPAVHIPLPVPVYWSFRGAFQTVLVNSRELNLLSGHSEGVSLGGVHSPKVLPTDVPSSQPATQATTSATTQSATQPTTQVITQTQAPTLATTQPATPTTTRATPPTATPTTTQPPTTLAPAPPQCAHIPVLPPSTTDLTSVMFGATSYDLNAPSYLGFNLNERQKGAFRQNLVFSLEIRSLTLNGVVFYAADSDSDPKEFVSLELLNGRLRYQFRSATGQVSIRTIKRYALNGLWYKVYLLRVYQLGAIVMPSTKEYHNNRHHNQPSGINISTPFYIGGLPSHVKAPSLAHRNLSFIGCLRNFQITSSQEDIVFDVNNPDYRGASVEKCNHQLEPGAYFNGEAWMRYDNIQLSPDFTITFRFRTNQRSGLLFSLDGSSGQGLILHQKLGQLVLKYVNKFLPPVELTWRPLSSRGLPDSYVVCQMEWYHIKISKTDSTLEMIVNGGLEVMAGLSDTTAINGTVSLGQPLGSELATDVSSFYGCLKQLVVNDVVFDLSRPTSQVNAKLSCPVYSSLA